jgi:uncharacterized protein (TIGR02099 family)
MAARIAVKLVFAAWVLLLGAWLLLRWWILPHVDDWRAEVERRSTQALGVPVHIGRIEVQSGGWAPALRLRDVVLSDAAGREALRLPQVAAVISPRSLLAFTLRFDQLLIEGAQLEVRRDAQGRLFVAGLPVQGGTGGSDGADWFFQQHEFVIRHGALRWTDEQTQAPPLALTDVNVVVRNGIRSHALRLDATPPTDWGARFSLQAEMRQPLLARAGDWRRWQGRVHASLPRADVSQLRRYLKLPFEIDEGDGALRAWVDVDRGEATGATVDLALNALSLKLQHDLQPLALRGVVGRVVAQRKNDGVRLGVQHFGFVTAEGQIWRPANVQVGWTQRQDRPDAPVTAGELTADHLDLGLMAEVAARLPLGEAVRQLLAKLAPQGQVQGLSARWDGPLDRPAHYRVKAHLAGLSIAAGPVPEAAASSPGATGRPGWRNAELDLDANETGGDAKLAVQHGALEFPGVFEEPAIALDRFSAQLNWRLTPARDAPAAPPAIELRLRNVRFANPDAEGELDATWRTGAGSGFGLGARFPGVLDMSGHLSRGSGTSVARYLPLGIPEATRRYVLRSVLGGRVDSARFKVKGDLWAFPFSRAGEGEFHIDGRVSDVTLAYVPPPSPGVEPAWPVFTQVAGELVFDRNSMQLRDAHARVYGYELQHVQGGIASFVNKPTLTIEGQGRGPLADALRYVNASPVGEWIGHSLQAAQGSGPSELKLALGIPLGDAGEPTVKGSVALLGDDLHLRPDVPRFLGTRARVEFTQKGFAVRNASARILGGDATINGGTQADGSVRFTAQGTATAEGMRRATEVPMLSRMAASFTGQAPYRLGLGVAGGHVDFNFTSPLTGLAMDLPEPLRKPADSALPLHVQTQAVSDPLGPRDQLRVELGNVLQAQYVRDVSRDSPVVLKGAVSVLDALPPLQAQVPAAVALPRFDADAWSRLVQRWSGDSAGSGSAADSGYVPRQLAVRAAELVADGRKLTHVVAGISALPGRDAGWRASVTADQLGGYLEYRPATGANAGKVFARLARLSLPPSDVSSVETLLDQGPSRVPALDVVIDDLELRGKKLGKVEIEALNQADGTQAAPDWRLSRFDLTVPEAHLQGSGRWAPDPAARGRRRMVMDFAMDISDSGALLTRLGTPGAIKGGAGRLKGQVSWAGSPFSLDYPTMNGKLNLALDKGQFLKAGPGAARLLGVLSLQSLPRRLALDFRDVFQEGFAFDHVDGDVAIQDGVAATNNLRMRGVQAAVLMAGQADLEHETQNLRVVVVPEINAGTASLAYAAINPAVGLGTFLAQLFLRKPLMAAGTREFHITGNWDDPKVEQVPHDANAPLPGDEAAASTPHTAQQ